LKIQILIKFKFIIEKFLSVFKGQTDNTLIQFIRYTFVGGSSFLVDFGALYIFTEYFHFYYLYSAGLSFILGLITNYFLSVSWVFNNRVIKNKFLEFLFFSIIGLIGLGLNELFIWLLTDLMMIHYLISKIITTFIVYFWNFFARKIVLFNKK
jgi:putative flippase GtrA